MKKLKEIINFLNQYLETDQISDISFNGLQIEGNTEINKILLTTDFSLESAQYAQKNNFDLMIVHHGQFWSKVNPSLVGFSKKRIKIMLDNNISLYACHLPLDKHKEVGNNAQLIKYLGAEIQSEFLDVNGVKISYVGKFKEPKKFDEIVEKMNTLGSNQLDFQLGKEKVETVAVCSGGGGIADFNEALKFNCDLYITGETSEIYHLAKENRVNLIFGGHHATEILGVKALGKIVEKKFGVLCRFVDFPTGL